MDMASEARIETRSCMESDYFGYKITTVELTTFLF